MPAALKPLSPRQAASLIGVDPKTIRRWIHAGLLPAIRLGNPKTGRLLIDPNDLALVYRAEVGGGSFSAWSTAPK